MHIFNKLGAIQAELKAPKNQYNEFGDYNYRSCEDILNALKPILQKLEAAITLSDEMVYIGDRYYIKATATIIDCGSDVGSDSYSVTAYARETEKKPKFDEAQLTGSASSYARKYALNGLLAIDDTKDADATNNGLDGETGGKNSLICADCGEEITEYGKYSAADVARMNQRNYGRKLCAKCAMKERNKGKGGK